MNYFNILYFVLANLACLYLLWVFYLAVMNLKRARDAGTLSKSALALGYPVLIVGWLLDFIGNTVAMTIVFLELPQELTITARLQRHHEAESGYRKAIADWAETILDAFDPSGNHV